MLRTKLFKWFCVLVLLFSAMSGILGTRMIRERVIEEVQTRVMLNLSSSRALFNCSLKEIETVVKLASTKEAVLDAAEAGQWNTPDLTGRLEKIRLSFGLDFMGIVASDGRVVLRTTRPGSVGDARSSDQAVASALKGEAKSCFSVMSAEELRLEGDGLGDKAFIRRKATPRARQSDLLDESRGMVMLSASPIKKGDRILGCIYGGTLVNSNHGLIDNIRDAVFKDDSYKGIPVGTATVFLYDTRIATTVRDEKGERAIGTMANREVADKVLDKGEPWIGDAYVLDNCCVTAYEAIRDASGKTIGMLYVGVLKAPFLEMEKSLLMRYAYVSAFALLIALVLSFYVAGRLAAPIHRLVQASNNLSDGHKPHAIGTHGTCHETELLVNAFNGMTQKLAEREERLKALNRSYMETLGFVSHELKSPLSAVMNYIYLMKNGKLGELTEKQQKAVKSIDHSILRLVDMVRHYLNLSRIENGELQPVRSKINLLEEVIDPLAASLEASLLEKKMSLRNDIGPGTVLHADLNMVREVFENIISNAVKYGRDGGTITLSSLIDGGMVRFGVRNSGDGIPADKVDKVFQKFGRIEDENAARKERGTGLGLFITKNIVEMHGGRIWIDMRQGEWIEFLFTLPVFKS